MIIKLYFQNLLFIKVLFMVIKFWIQTSHSRMSGSR